MKGVFYLVSERERERERQYHSYYTMLTYTQQQQHTYRDPQTMYRTYYTHYYPFDAIVRFITCNKPLEYSPQYRDLRFECLQWSSCSGNNTGAISKHNHWSKKHFDRRNAAFLRAHIQADLPQSIHISSLIPLRIDPVQFLAVEASPQTMQKRKRMAIEYDTATTNNSRSNSADNKFVSPLRESHEADFVHLIPGALKELVFDIDVPDFHRFCRCTDTTRVEGPSRLLCDTCWLHLEGTYFIMLFVLCHQLGYARHNVMCVFSGGKGLHFFVNASRAMNLDDTQRLFLHDTLNIRNGSGAQTESNGDMALFDWIAQAASRDLSDQLERLFHETVLVRRNLLVREPGFTRWVLEKLKRHYPSVHMQVASRWSELAQMRQNDADASVVMWSLLKTFEVYRERSDDSGETRSRVRPTLFLVYRLYYPMIDKMPMKMNHAIKLPFSINAKSGNVSLPVDAAFIEASDKATRIVHIEALYDAHRAQCETPPLFQRGMEILDEWLCHY